MESKNRMSESSSSRKLGLSCAECRRSKLKCDRSFPCQSCIRRGCAGLCPEGTLTATKGNKVLMAHAQRLSEQVETLQGRIQELESLLAKSRGDGTYSPLPSGLPGIDRSDADVSDAIGSLSIGANGQAKYHGESASSEYFQNLLDSDDDESTVATYSGLDLPPEIVELMNTFPFGLKDCPLPKSTMKSLFLDFIPPKDTVLQLADLYYSNFSWMYDPVPIGEFNSTILVPLYGSGNEPNLDDLHSHRISVFFMLLANGCIAHSSPSVSAKFSRKYHALARAAMSLDPITSEATCATIQSLFLTYRFLYTVERFCTEERWLLTGVSTRLAHSLGLQRDGSNWNLEPEEIQRRRRVFWELFVWESWGSLVNGRPSSLSIQQSDCLFPDDLEPHIRHNGEVEPGWNAWKYRYASICVTASAALVFGPKSPSYTALLDLDKKIRGFPVPESLRALQEADGTLHFSSTSRLAVQQLAVLLIKETNLLYVHRSYFAQAVRQAPQNPLQHKYSHSVMTAYHSARTVLAGLRKVYEMHPHPTSLTWYFWSSLFSACIVLGAVVVESPTCSLAGNALQELREAVLLYEQGTQTLGAQGSVAALDKLLQRAILAFTSSREGDSDAGRTLSVDANIDDLEVLSGRRTVIAKTSRGSSSSPKAGVVHGRIPTSEVHPSTGGPADLLVDFFKSSEDSMMRHRQSQDFDVLDSPHYLGGYAPKDDVYNLSSSGRGPPFESDQFHMDNVNSSIRTHHHPDMSNRGDDRQAEPWRGVPSQSSSSPRSADFMNVSVYGNNSVFDSPAKFQGDTTVRYSNGAENQADVWRHLIHEFGSN